MGMRKLLFLQTILLLVGNLFGQNPTLFSPLYSEAPLPEVLLKSSGSKYFELLENSSTEDEARFYLESNFTLDELMESGLVLFNDPVSKYINAVADELLAHDPALRKQLRFYTVRAAAPNAFATDRGSIFINLGLLSRLENEAQLAFIIAHELVHYLEQHNQNTFVEYARIDRSQGVFKRRSNFQRLLQKNNYSKSLEKAADADGLDWYLKSKYSLEAALSTFDILAFSHVPYKNSPFDPGFLEGPNIKLPKAYLLEKVNPVRMLDDDDHLSTHPSVLERKQLIKQAISELSNKGRYSFILAEEAFRAMRLQTRYELIRVQLQNRQYVEALYQAFLLGEEQATNPFVLEVKAKALYGIAQYENANRLREIYDPIRIAEQQGQIQQLYYLIHQLSSKELNVLAAYHCWQAHKALPDSEGLRLAAQDMIEDLVIYTIDGDPFTFFKQEALPPGVTEFLPYAFADLLQDPAFTACLEKGTRFEQPQRLNAKQAQKQRIRSIEKGASLGLDQLVFVNPFYQKLNLKNDNPVLYIESEDRQKDYVEMLQRNGKRLDLEVGILDVEQVDSSSAINSFNDMVRVNNWMEEHLSHDMYMISSTYDEVLPVCDNWGVDHFAYSGTISARTKGQGKTAEAVFSFLFVFTSPIGVYKVATPSYGGVHFLAVFDVRQSKTLMTSVNFLDTLDKDALIESNIYWALKQVKRKSKNR